MSWRFARNTTRALAVGLIAGLLAACSGIRVTCTAEGTIGNPPPKQKSIRPTTAGPVIEAQIAGSVFMDSSAAAMLGALSGDSIDASSITMDTSGSNVQWPQSGSVSLTIRNKADNAVLAARSFSWSRNGSTISFSDPGAVNSWLGASGANASQHKVDYAFENLTMPAHEGTNLVAVDVYQNNVPRSTASFTLAYERPRCRPGVRNCHEP